uniref:SPOR domain-containing protein n=1 Tax=Neisseria dentiae TaxID=194197 RepID=UPI0035A14F6F
QQETNPKAAQDALNNKSAQASVEKSDPKTILEGKPASKKAIIQAGAYSNHDQAKQMQQKLADAGVSAYITEVETSKGKVYRVRTGHYPDRETAGKALERLRKKGADGIVIGQP